MRIKIGMSLFPASKLRTTAAPSVWQTEKPAPTSANGGAGGGGMFYTT